MPFKCIGCDRDIGWDGEGMFSYTCPCGATIFYAEGGRMAYPFSLIRNLQRNRPLPHLDDLVGESDHSSPIKERMIKELREKGFIWMKECDQCLKDGTHQHKLERENYLAIKEAESILRRDNE